MRNEIPANMAIHYARARVRDDGKRFIVRADEKLTAFAELEMARLPSTGNTANAFLSQMPKALGSRGGTIRGFGMGVSNPSDEFANIVSFAPAVHRLRL
jgi:hypothetical protein